MPLDTSMNSVYLLPITPTNLPGAGDQATGNMGRQLKESVMIAKTFCKKFLEKIDPFNQFFEK